VEFIARKGIAEKYDSPDGSIADKILHLSEIGLPTSEVAHIADALAEKAGIARYDGDKSRFCAAGDVEGLFIIVDYNQKKWIPMMDEAIAFPFETLVENNRDRY
jgi:hypothetical protein